MRRLQHIRLRHFRSHHATDIDLQKFTFLRGRNKTGKSTIRMAIEMTLTGRCEVTDEAGSGAEQLIEEGAQTATVELRYDDVIISLKLDRSAPRSVKIQLANNVVILGRHAQEWIANNIAPRDIVSACLDAYRFFSMSQKEQQSLLARVLLPPTLELSEEATSMLAASGLHVVERYSLFSTIDATLEQVKQARASVHSRLRDLQNLEEPVAPKKSREQIKAEARAVEAEQEQINTQISAIRAAQNKIARANEEIEKLDKQIADFEQQLAELPPVLSQSALGKLVAAVNRAEAQKQQEQYLETARGELAMISSAMQQLEDNTTCDECPICRTPLTAELRRTLFNPLIAQKTVAQTKVRKIEQQLADWGDFREAARLIDADRNTMQQKHQLEHVIETAKEQRAEAHRIASDASLTAGTQESIAELEKRALELKQRFVADVDELVQIVAAEEKVADYQRKLTLRAELEQRHVELEKLVAYFGPSGLPATLIRDRLEAFTAKVNDMLRWWDYSMTFAIEPFLIQVNEAGSTAMLRPRQLSASEQYRLGIAFAAAIAEWTGFKMLICDAAEILDKWDKSYLADALINSALDQALVFSTGVGGTFRQAGTAFYTLSKENAITEITLDSETADEVHGEAVTCQ